MTAHVASRAAALYFPTAMDVVVTGATGALGLASTRTLVRAGHRVRAFVRAPEKFRRLSVEQRVELVEGDILDRRAVASALAGAEAVLHCVDFPLRSFEGNWDALRHVLESLPQGAQLIYPGNVWVYGPPTTPRVGEQHPKRSPSRLGRLKADFERAALAEGGTVVRLPDCYGPGVRHRWMGKAFERAAASRPVRTWRALDRKTEFIYIDDAARALVAPLSRGGSRGREYNAAATRPITPERFFGLIFEAAGHPPRIRAMPHWWLRLLGLLHPHYRSVRSLSYVFKHPLVLDGTRMRKELGWIPEIDYPEGVRRTVRDLTTTTGQPSPAAATPPSD